jgi:hypothetical protein
VAGAAAVCARTVAALRPESETATARMVIAFIVFMVENLSRTTAALVEAASLVDRTRRPERGCVRLLKKLYRKSRHFIGDHLSRNY